MKIFKTDSAALPLQDMVFIIAESDKTSLIQLDNRGRYISDMEGIILTEGKYAINKDQFFNALKVMGKGFTIEAETERLVFRHKDTEVAVKTYDFTLTEIEVKDHEFKDIPENFMAIIKEASSIALQSKEFNIMNGIKVIDNKVYATDTTVVFCGELNGSTGLDVILPGDILKVIENPTHFDNSETGTIVLKSERGIAEIRTFDGLFPQRAVEKLLKKKPTTSSIFAEGALKQVSEAINDAKTMGHTEVILSKDATIYGATPDVPEVKRTVAVTIPNSSKFYIGKLMKVLKDSEVYSDGGTNFLYVYAKGRSYVLAPTIME